MNKPEPKKSPRRCNDLLARDNQRVGVFVDTLLDQVDEIVQACRQDDWSEVRRLAENMRDSSNVYGVKTVMRRAEEVCQALEDPENKPQAREGIIKLIGVCGSPPGGTDRPKAG